MKKIPMIEKVCKLYEEEQTETRKPVGFMQSCCFVFVGILMTYKWVLLIISY